MKEEKIHIGALVKNFVKENNINASELARKLGEECMGGKERLKNATKSLRPVQKR